MKCPYCDNEMAEGAIFTQKVPEWKDANSKFILNAKKHMATNEIKGYHCSKCNKIVLENVK